MNWEPVIGLEIHVQLATKSKIFSGASATFGAEPNTQACAIDLGLPGVLPVLNKETVRMAIMFGLAVEATIASHPVFARKNYFYPDLPKGYQISQYENPIVANGRISISLSDEKTKIIGITRAHLEEDAGKSLHDEFTENTGIDLNRAGTPLLEIVSEPDMRSAAEAIAYMKKIHSIVCSLGISDGNMQEGSFRCDANVSIRPIGETKLGTRTEIKNLNSFRFLEKAIQYEIERQQEVLAEGDGIVQETRLYNSLSGETRSMRSKEEANDYRYFPDPDLLPVEIDASYVEFIRKTLPELPDVKKKRFQQQYELNNYDADALTLDEDTASYFENLVTQHQVPPKLAVNWMLGELAAILNQHDLSITQCPIRPALLAEMLHKIMDGTISGKMGKEIFHAMWHGEGTANEIIKKRGLEQISDQSALETIVDLIIAQNADQVAQYRAGKEKVFSFFVGQVMKNTKGQANPQQVNLILKKKLMQ